MTKATVRQSYIELRGLNLGMGFIRENRLAPGQKYPMVIEGLEEGETEGTLDRSGMIGGLSKLYNEYELQVGDPVEVRFDDGVIRLTPPLAKKRRKARIVELRSEREPVFERQDLRHVHLDPFTPGNLSRWTARGEADVYLVFGVLSEYTDYHYCCGVNQELLAQLGYTYTGQSKPDAVLIDRTTGQYLMAEFKVNSRDFAGNHDPDDVDVLVCWNDDETDRPKLPREVVELHAVLATAIKDGDLDL